MRTYANRILAQSIDFVVFVGLNLCKHYFDCMRVHASIMSRARDKILIEKAY